RRRHRRLRRRELLRGGRGQRRQLLRERGRGQPRGLRQQRLRRLEEVLHGRGQRREGGRRLGRVQLDEHRERELPADLVRGRGGHAAQRVLLPRGGEAEPQRLRRRRERAQRP